MNDLTVNEPVLKTDSGLVPVTPSKETAPAESTYVPTIVIVFPETDHVVEAVVNPIPLVGVHPEIVNSVFG